VFFSKSEIMILLENTHRRIKLFKMEEM